MSDENPILLVDDDPSIRKLCSRLLTRMNLKVVECGLGKEALDAIQGPTSFQTVFLDITLPDISGTDLYVEFRKLHPDLPIILFTGGSPPIQEPGMIYLKKPFTRASLSQALQEAGVTH